MLRPQTAGKIRQRILVPATRRPQVREMDPPSVAGRGAPVYLAHGIFGLAALVFAVALPLGLERPATGATIADGCGLTGGSEAPLALLAIRLFAFLPLGDLALRAALASAVVGALAVALLAGLACEALAAARPGEPKSAERTGRAPTLPDPDVERVAAVGAALVVGLSLGFFRAATGAGGTALSVALVVAVWTRALRMARAPQPARQGLTLALLAGLACGAQAAAVPLIWAPVLALWMRGLWRKQRWSLLAPLLFVAGAAVVLFSVAAAGAPVSPRELIARLWPAATGGARVAALEAAEQIGVLGLLLGALGSSMLALRAPLAALLMAGATATGLWISGDGVVLAMAALAPPLAVGIAQVAGKLGRARLAAAAVVVAMAVVAPALDGGASRWRRDIRVPARLIEHALALAPVRARIDPGSAPMNGLFRYAALLGLRQDLTVTPRSFPSR
jgi:hypothetical protein